MSAARASVLPFDVTTFGKEAFASFGPLARKDKRPHTTKGQVSERERHAVVSLPQRPKTCPPRLSTLKWNGTSVRDLGLLTSRATYPVSKHVRSTSCENSPLPRLKTFNNSPLEKAGKLDSVSPVSATSKSRDYESKSNSTAGREKKARRRIQATAISAVKSSHSQFCSEGVAKPFSRIADNPDSNQFRDVKAQRAYIHTILQARQRRARNPAGFSNIAQVSDLSRRSSNWWWKESKWPVQAIEGDEDSIKASVLWPSQKARRGMSLRNIECSTGIISSMH